MPDEYNELLTIIKEEVPANFFGILEIHFQNGVPSFVKTITTKKLPDVKSRGTRVTPSNK
jgi:hypothetical protein